MAGSVTGLPIPRYVSLKADRVNMHIGPGKQYEPKWVYQRAGLPVAITAAPLRDMTRRPSSRS